MIIFLRNTSFIYIIDGNTIIFAIINRQMQQLLSHVSIQVNKKIYLKNPESSELGFRILEGSVDLIQDMGFEQFTFRKLAKEINSTEATIYRYFESKHKLLLYLISWYWGWLEYKLVFGLANIVSAEEKLERAIVILTEQIVEDGNFSHINEVKLNKIMITESSKGYLTKDVDTENREGVFIVYKQLVKRVGDIILEINPNYDYPHTLVSTIMEGVHLQRYFAEHLPGLTDVVVGEDSIVKFYKELVVKAIKN